MSTLKVNTLQNTSGNGRYAAHAWINFTGLTTTAIQDDAGYSSITDQGAGNTRVNLDNAMSDANYLVVGTGALSSSGGLSGVAPISVTTTRQDIHSENQNSANQDAYRVYVAVME